MKFVRYFLTFGLALVIFIGVLVSENGRYETLTRINNPFSGDQNFEERQIILREMDESEDIFLPSGEFFKFFPRTKAIFHPQVRELAYGEMFASGTLIESSDVVSPQDILTENGFDFKNWTPQPGQIRVGDILLDYLGSNIFVNRDLDTKRIHIYVQGHSLELYFPEAQKPFVVPPGMQITLRENLITPHTWKLYYSKQVKEFSMQKYLTVPMPTASPPPPHSPEEQLIYTVWEQQQKIKRMETYASSLSESWIPMSQSSFFRVVAQPIQSLQMRFAIGYPQSKKDRYVFETLVYPLGHAIQLLERGKEPAARQELEKFKANAASDQWKQLMEHNTEIRAEWNSFLRAQKGWLSSLYADDPFQIFNDFWKSLSGETPPQKIKRMFSQIELFVSGRRPLEARDLIKAFESTLSETDLTATSKYEITKYRRLTEVFLNQETLLQEPEVFALYRTLVKKELALHDDPDYIDEMRLEVTQNILIFLRTFLQEKTNIEIAKLLVEIYDMVNVEEIQERLGRDVFSEADLETITFVKAVGKTDLTEHQIQQLKEDKTAELKIQERARQIQEEQRLIAQEKEERRRLEALKNQITTKQRLKEFLQESGINVDVLTIRTLRKDDQVRYAFENGFFEQMPVTGTFDVSSQIFTNFQVNGNKRENVHQRYLLNVLQTIARVKEREQQQQTTPSQIKPQQNQDYIPQSTKAALLERNLVLQMLQAEGFSVSRDDIEITNKNMTLFKVKNVSYGSIRGMSFVFENEGERLRDVTIQIKEDTITLQSDWTPRIGSANMLEHKYTTIYKEKYAKQ